MRAPAVPLALREELTSDKRSGPVGKPHSHSPSPWISLKSPFSQPRPETSSWAPGTHLAQPTLPDNRPACALCNFQWKIVLGSAAEPGALGWRRAPGGRKGFRGWRSHPDCVPPSLRRAGRGLWPLQLSLHFQPYGLEEVPSTLWASMSSAVKSRVGPEGL